MNQNGILQQLPDLSPILNLKAEAESTMQQVFNRLGDEPGTFITPLSDALDSIMGYIPTEPGEFQNLIAEFPDQVEKFFPENVDELITPIKDGIGKGIESVSNGPFKDLLPDLENGKTIEQLATDTLNSARDEIVAGITDAAGSFFTDDRFQSIQDFLDVLNDFQNNLPDTPEELVEFLNDGFLGVPEDLLLEARNASASLLQNLELNLSALNNIKGFKDSYIDFTNQAITRLNTFDLENENHYDEVINLLSQAETQLSEITTTLSSLSTEITSALDEIDLDNFRRELKSAYENIPPVVVFGINEIAGLITEPFDHINQLLQSAAPDEIRHQIKKLLADLLTSFDSLAKLIQENPIFEFFEDVKNRVESLDINDVNNLINGFLNNIDSNVDKVDANLIKTQFTQAVDRVKQIVNEINFTEISDEIVDGFQTIRDIVQGLPINEIETQLNAAFDKLDELVQTLKTGSESAITPLQNVRDELTNLSFRDKAQPAFDAMEEVKVVLETIDFSTLPDAIREPAEEAVEEFKSAIGGNDPIRFFQEDVVEFLIERFETAEVLLRELTDAIEKGLQKFKQALEEFDPGAVLDPLIEPYENIKTFVDKLDGDSFINPVKEIVQQIVSEMEKISPESIFQPLEQAFDYFLGKLNEFSPGSLLAPLKDIYDQFQGLLQQVDITQLLQQAPDLGTNLMGDAKSNLVSLFDTTRLPIETTSLTEKINPLLELANPATDPDNLIPLLQNSIGALKPGDIFIPLQEVYDSFLDITDQVDDELLVTSFQSIQSNINHLDRVDPAQLPQIWNEIFNGLLSGVEQNGPNGLISTLSSLYENLQTSFSHIDPNAVPESLQGKYDDIQTKIDGINPTPVLTPLISDFTDLPHQIETAHQPLDLDNLVDLFIPLRHKLESLIPQFLKSDLTIESIRQGLQQTSPANLKQIVDESYDALLATASAFTDILREEVMDFLDKLGEKVSSLSLSGILEIFQGIFDAITEKLTILNPDTISAELDATYQGILNKINEFHPRIIKESLQSIYDDVIANVNAIDLDSIKNEINGAIADIKTALNIDIEAIRDNIKLRFDSAINEFAGLQLVPTFEGFADELTRLRNDLESTLNEASNKFNSMVNALP